MKLTGKVIGSIIVMNVESVIARMKRQVKEYFGEAWSLNVTCQLSHNKASVASSSSDDLVEIM